MEGIGAGEGRGGERGGGKGGWGGGRGEVGCRGVRWRPVKRKVNRLRSRNKPIDMCADRVGRRPKRALAEKAPAEKGVGHEVRRSRRAPCRYPYQCPFRYPSRNQCRFPRMNLYRRWSLYTSQLRRASEVNFRNY